MPSDKFKASYDALNPQQKKAVDTIDGPVMVIAGPGTGKTQILTLRIANILLKTQTEPENILALTFTESGVQAMRKRLVDIIGTPGYKVSISTFHSFCNEIIKKNAESFPYDVSESITEVEQIQIMEQLLVSAKELDKLKPFNDPLYYLRPALSAINELKKEGVTVEAFKKAIEAQEEDFAKIEDLHHDKGKYKGQMKGKYQDLLKDIEKNKELALIYDLYRKALRENKLYDYNDMLLEVINILDNDSNLLLRLQETYQYILVDEHQDTNTAQNKLIEKLGNFYENPNLFVVGDEKQAIFRFQGASLENFLYFKNLYPEATLINLEDNYRSTQTILDGAASLIKHNISSEILSGSLLRSNIKGDGSKISVAKFGNYYAEYHFLAGLIKEKIANGASAKEIAILVRNNRDIMPVADALEHSGIPFRIESDQNLLSDPYIRKLLTLFSCANNFGSDAEVFKCLHYDFLGADPLDVYKLMHYVRTHRSSVINVISDESILKKIGLKNHSLFSNFYNLINTWNIKGHNDNMEHVFVEVLNQSGFLKFVLSRPNSFDILDKITALFEEVKIHTSKNPDYSLSDFMTYLGLLKNHDILIKKTSKSSYKETVRLMTAHKSKGLEFEYVLIPQSYDGHWGNMRKRGSSFKIPWEFLGLKLKVDFEIEENEDERRLFYVALTRAKKELFISYSTTSIDGKEQLPSQFLEEIDEEFKKDLDTQNFEKDFEADKTILFRPGNQDVNPETRNFLVDCFRERGMSVSALNNYLSCPWKFFYRNLLLLPDVKTPSLVFGSAVHKAINLYIKASKAAMGDIGLEYLLQSYKTALEKEAQGQDFEGLMKKGEKVLTGFYKSQMRGWNYQNMMTETFIKGVKLTEDLTLTGALDLIEQTSGTEAIVYDFKTGKPKSRGDIEGTTASRGSGDYKRQLVFYKILLENYQFKKLHMKAGGIVFVEPDDKGNFRKELFEITEEEVKALEFQLKNVAEEIVNLAFWDRFCDERDCEYCELRRVMGTGTEDIPVGVRPKPDDVIPVVVPLPDMPLVVEATRRRSPAKKPVITEDVAALTLFDDPNNGADKNE